MENNNERRPRAKPYSEEEKKKFVDHYLDLRKTTNLSIAEICTQLGVSHTSIRGWMKGNKPQQLKQEYNKKYYIKRKQSQPKLIQIPMEEPKGDMNKKILISLVENTIQNMKTILEIISEK